MLFPGKKTSRAINPLGISERNHGSKNGLTVENFFYWAMLLSFIGVTGFILFFSDFLAVTDIRVRGAEKINSEAAKEQIASLLSGSYLNFLPKNNIILIRKKKIEELLGDHFKLIYSVKIEKKFPSGLDIYLTEKNPQLIMRSDGRDYVIDDKGIAYEKSDFESDFLQENRLIILEDGGSKKVIVKSEALSPDYIRFILEAKDQLSRDLDIGINQVVKVSNIISGDITVETDAGWKIYLNKNVGVQKELEMLEVVLNNKIEKGKRGELEYIDLRTDNKVYYKFKNAEQKAGN